MPLKLLMALYLCRNSPKMSLIIARDSLLSQFLIPCNDAAIHQLGCRRSKNCTIRTDPRYQKVRWKLGNIPTTSSTRTKGFLYSDPHPNGKPTSGDNLHQRVSTVANGHLAITTAGFPLLCDMFSLVAGCTCHDSTCHVWCTCHALTNRYVHVMP